MSKCGFRLDWAIRLLIGVRRSVAFFPNLKFKLQRELHLPGILRA